MAGFQPFAPGNGVFSGVRFGAPNPFGQWLQQLSGSDLGLWGYGNTPEDAVMRDKLWGQFLNSMRQALNPAAFTSLSSPQTRGQFETIANANPMVKFGDVTGNTDWQRTWENMTPTQAGRFNPFFGNRWSGG